MEGPTHIDPRIEKVFPLKELGKQLGVRVPYNTAFGWHHTGLVNPWTRKRIRLKTIRITCGLGTSLEEYWRFIDRLNEQPSTTPKRQTTGLSASKPLTIRSSNVE